MKNLKKLAALVLALMLTLSLGISFATDADNPDAPTTGSITINGISVDAGDNGNKFKTTYTIYRLLDLESYNAVSGAYSYKVNSDWAGFFATEGALAYVAIDDNGYVTWKVGEDDDTVAAFAKLALAYAKDNGIEPKASNQDYENYTWEPATEEKKASGTFSGLELGYYLVDSTMGALCGLTTTNPNASINAKNGQPTIDKQVEEDSTQQWGGSNSADIGQIVNFRTTINVHAGAENYVLHDQMSPGLTFQGVTDIQHVVPGSDTHPVDSELYTVVTKEGLDDDCTFEIRFSKELCDELATNDKLIVHYAAMVNRDAIVASTGNTNESWLDFGEGNHTTHDTTQTYTFGFDLVKTDSQNALIDGAEFKIYDAATEGNEVAVVLMDDGVTYRRARTDETGVSIVVKDGKVRVVGFDNGPYYLEETVSPAGYNKLTSRQKFIISDGNLDAIFNDGIFSTGSGVHVVNKTGTMLPETGGIGTTLFYAVGGLLVAAAAVLLITKKRMSIAE